MNTNDAIRDMLWADVYAREKAANKFAGNPKHEADMAVRHYDDRLRATPAPGAPAGFKLAPIEPTVAMAQAGYNFRPSLFSDDVHTVNAPMAVYRAMLDAAPGAPGQEAAAVQAAGQDALFWYRPCGDNLYEGPFHANSTEGKQLREEKPDAWHPLYTAAVGGWQDIATAPEGVLVIVGWRDKEDAENPDRHMFDYLEDGIWANYFSEHEHYSIAGVAHGLSEDAPYTHWMPMGPIPAALPPSGAGEKTS